MVSAWLLRSAFVLAAFVTTPALGETVRLHVASGEISGFSDRHGKEVALSMTRQSFRDLGEFTLRHVGEKIHVAIDGRVLVSPVVREPNLGGTVRLPIAATDAELRGLIGKLIAGTVVLEFRSTGEAVPLKTH
jgi:preprotein translocase subunit SecD